MAEPILPGYTRVSTVLEYFSGIENVNPEVLKIAGDRGTLIHTACDCIVQNLGLFCLEDQVRSYCRNDEHAVQEMKKVQGCIESFEKWLEFKNKLSFFKVKRLYMDELMITGEVDFLYESPEGLTLLDLKTSSQESSNWLLQGSAYAHMLRLQGRDVKRIEFLKLSRTGGKAKSFFYEENFPLFKAHYDAYNYSYKNRKRFEDSDFL